VLIFYKNQKLFKEHIFNNFKMSGFSVPIKICEGEKSSEVNNYVTEMLDLVETEDKYFKDDRNKSEKIKKNKTSSESLFNKIDYMDID